jgi:hypothetical protein
MCVSAERTITLSKGGGVAVERLDTGQVLYAGAISCGRAPGRWNRPGWGLGLIVSTTAKPHGFHVACGRWLKSLKRRFWGVDNVNTFGVGLGRTSAGLGRIRYVFWSSQCLQGLECSSSPTSGTADPLVRGDFCFNVCTKLVVASL